MRDEGFRRVWMAQLPYEADVLTVLAVAMREVDTIEVGSGVLPIQVQHPTSLAQRALTLNTIAGGRFILGLGMSHRMVTEQMWGVSWDKPVRQMREYLDGLLPLLAGLPAEAEGEFWTTRGALQMPGAPAPDVHIAALGPQMLRLAGRRTSGTLTWMTGPKTLAEHVVPTLRGAAVDAGRLRARCGWRPAFRSASPTISTAPARRPRSSSRCTASCRRIARCSTGRGTPIPRMPPSSATRKRCLIDSTTLSAVGVDEFSAVVFDASPEVRDRTRALLRTKDSGRLKFPLV